VNILYIGDIMGQPGIETVETVLPQLIKVEAVDMVIAQAENVSGGKGITLEDYSHLRSIGVDFFTGGNWSMYKPEILQSLLDPDQPIIAPANYPAYEYGPGYKYITKNGKTALVISLLGRIVGKDANKELLNPLKTIDDILANQSDKNKDAIIVNFHGDYSSEKVIIGHYLDGRVSLIVGDHWHVPTADARLLPKGSAHISDVGMCGVLDASLGVKFDSVLPRWRDEIQTRNVLETEGPRQFNAVLVNTFSQNSAASIKQIQTGLS
jgi:metallophosphoesterase (TIGR00282 family)